VGPLLMVNNTWTLKRFRTKVIERIRNEEDVCDEITQLLQFMILETKLS